MKASRCLFIPVIFLSLSDLFPPLSACSCVPPPPAKEALEQSDVVFRGRAMDRVFDTPVDLRVVFEPTAVWKGPTSTTLDVFTEVDGVACGFPFFVGEEYIVFAWVLPEGIWTNVCSKTGIYNPDIETQLGPPAWKRPDAKIFKRGDPIPDGTSDIGDAIAILSFLFLASPERLDCEKSADIDDSGTLEITDVVGLLGHLFLGEPPPRAPFAQCGADPTEDPLTCQSYPPCGPF